MLDKGLAAWNKEAKYINKVISELKDKNQVVDEDKLSEYYITNSSIEKFLNPSGPKRIISAPKGFGKSLFLYIKHAYFHNVNIESSGGFSFIPSDGILATTGDQDSLFNKEDVYLLGDYKQWKKIWDCCLVLTIINSELKRKSSNIEEKVNVLSDLSKKALDSPSWETLYQYIDWFIGLSPKQKRDYLKEEHNVLKNIFSTIKHQIVFFIDDVDKYLDECHVSLENYNGCLDGSDEPIVQKETISGFLSPMTWYACQMGLLHSIHDLSHNEHIKIIASLRKEAIKKYSGTFEQGQNIMNIVVELEYDRSQLKEIFERNIEFLDPLDLVKPELLEINPIESFIGFSEISDHSGNFENEDIFDFIIRHTFHKPRDLMYIGQSITDIAKDKRNQESVSKALHKGADQLAKFDLSESKLSFDFNKLFSLIKINTLKSDELIEICGKFNEIESSMEGNRFECSENCETCEGKHVFCEMYNSGYLGVIQSDNRGNKVQYFKLNDKYNVNQKNTLPSSELYLLHPAIGAYIQKNRSEVRGGELKVNRNIIIGHQLEWNVYLFNRYCTFNNKILNTPYLYRPDGVFICSSGGNAQKMEYLSKFINDKRPDLTVSQWTKIENSGSGDLYTQEIMFKVISNHITIGLTSDYNPNVFFEIGYAYGLGRFVVIENDLKCQNEFIGKLQSLRLLDINNPSALEDTVNSLPIQRNNGYSFSEVMGIFDTIDNFENPSARRKSNSVYLVKYKSDDEEKIDNCSYKYLSNHKPIPFDINLLNDLLSSKSTIFEINGRKRGESLNINHYQIQDCHTLLIAGFCAAQGVNVRVVKRLIDDHTERDTYSDCRKLTIENVQHYINSLSLS